MKIDHETPQPTSASQAYLVLKNFPERSRQPLQCTRTSAEQQTHLACRRVTREFGQGELSAAQYYRAAGTCLLGRNRRTSKSCQNCCLTQSGRGAAVRGLAPSPGRRRGAWQAGTAGGLDSGVGPTCQQVRSMSAPTRYCAWPLLRARRPGQEPHAALTILGRSCHSHESPYPPPSSFWPAKLPAEAPGRPPALTPRRQQPPLHHRKAHIHMQEYFRFSPSYLAEMPQAGFVLCFLKVMEGETDQDAGLCPRCRRQ